MSGRPLSRADVLAARSRLAGHVEASPLELSGRLTERLGRPVWLKREDLQPVRSYKLRGAWSAICHAAKDRHGPVVCASAGNHAQGVAWACARLGIDGVVVLPETTPRQKRERIRALGAGRVRIEMYGRVYDDAAEHAAVLATGCDGLVVSAFDDPLVVSGQGSVGVEIVEQLAAAGVHEATVVVPVGGGGLMAGCALAFDGSGFALVGVEPAGAASLSAARAAGTPVRVGEVDTFVDGAAVARVGDVPWSVLAGRDDRLVVVEEGLVASVMLELYQHDGIVAEPAGALSVAALDRLGELGGSSPLVAVISGGNNDVSRYAEVIERSLVFRGVKQYFLVEFEQAPGALRRFLDRALGAEDDIVLFEYVKKSNRESGPALVGVELGDPTSLGELCRRMTDTGIRFERVEPGSALQRFLV